MIFEISTVGFLWDGYKPHFLEDSWYMILWSHLWWNDERRSCEMVWNIVERRHVQVFGLLDKMICGVIPERGNWV